MRPGNLNRRVTLQTRSATRVDGERAQTWTTLADVWAEVLPLSGRELELAQAINAEVSHQVTVRYRTGVDTSIRILYQGRHLAVKSVVDVDGRHVWLQMLCSEGLSDGL